jgi:hypothetical protein
VFDSKQIVLHNDNKKREKMIKEAMQFIGKTMVYQSQKRLHNPKEMNGKSFINSDGHEFVIFRQTILDPVEESEREPEAVFRVQFKVAKIRPGRDRMIIAMKSPVFVALPGFRSKLWMVDTLNNTYQGVYEWATLKDAEDYVHSYSMEFMNEVAIPGGLSYEIIPGGKIMQNGQKVWILKSSN